MATLPSDTLGRLSVDIARDNEVGYVKQDLNDALQAVEDWFEANRTALSTAIDNDTTYSFSNAEKKRLIKYWLKNKFGRE